MDNHIEGSIRQSARWDLTRWTLSYAMFGIPQAAAPVAFSLLAMSLGVDVRGGAALVLILTVAQAVGAVPVARAGRRLPLVTYLRVLLGMRTVSLLALSVIAAAGGAFWSLIACAAVAGLASGGGYGLLRAVLNELVERGMRARALGIAATLNELTFVSAPVAAAVLGAWQPVIGVLVFGLLGALPLLVLTRVDSRPIVERSRMVTLLRPATVLWLATACVTTSVVACVEVGTVALALRYGLQPIWGFVFATALCIASLCGGIWVGVRNRMLSRWLAVGLMLITTAGAGIMAMNLSILATLVGAVLIGICLAPLGTHYSLILDDVAPLGMHTEAFALLRAAVAGGVILGSGLLAFTSLDVSFAVCAAAACVVTLSHALLACRHQ